MNKSIIYDKPDGGVAICRVAPIENLRRLPQFAEMDDDEILALVQAKDVPATATNVSVVDVDAIPGAQSVERKFRNAYEQDETVSSMAVRVNMPKARAIKTGMVREDRNMRLGALDVPYMRADEDGDRVEKARIAARKQKLRDLPADIQSDLDALDTPEALETYQPAWPE
jgi:hypothetical protein